MIRFINNDGIGASTRIEDSVTGDDISKIIAVSYGVNISIDETITATVKAAATISMIAIDVTAGKTIFNTKHPLTGDYEPLAAMEFRDGSRVEFAEDGTPKLIRK